MIRRLSLKLIALLYSLFVTTSSTQANVELLVLGVAQDAGYPQINCYQPHCIPGWKDKNKRKLATSLAIIDHKQKEKFIFEATPNIGEQLYRLHQQAPDPHYRLGGIFLSHAHMGHYTGLMYFGREAQGSKAIPVYVMPKMLAFLSSNGPWSQLVKLNNIRLRQLTHQKPVNVNTNIEITAILVPHRDEFSETVGFYIIANGKRLLFIPDIDKWKKWDQDIGQWVRKVDYAFLDATFYANGELPNRDMSEVPHPFVIESMAILKDLEQNDKAKVHFIHFNHTNPLLNVHSKAFAHVKEAGFNIAVEGMRIRL